MLYVNVDILDIWNNLLVFEFSNYYLNGLKISLGGFKVELVIILLWFC